MGKLGEVLCHPHPGALDGDGIRERAQFPHQHQLKHPKHIKADLVFTCIQHEVAATSDLCPSFYGRYWANWWQSMSR